MTIASLIVDVGTNTSKLTTGADEAVGALEKLESVSTTTSGSVDRLADSHGKLQAAANVLSTVGLPEAAIAVDTLATAEVGATVAAEGLATATSFLVTYFTVFVAAAVLVGEAIVKIAQRYEEAQLAAETLAAKQDVINKAIAEGAPAWISYGDAVKYVNTAFEHQQKAIPAVAAQQYMAHLQEVTNQQTQAAIEAWALQQGLAAIGHVLGEAGIGEQLKKQFEDGEKAIRKTREEHERWLQSVRDATIHMNLSTFTLHRFGAVELPMVESSLKGVDTELDHLDSVSLPDFHTKLQKIGESGIAPVTRHLDLLHATLAKLGQAFSPTSLFSNLVHSGMTAIFGVNGIITNLAQKGLELLGNLVMKGLSKIVGYFKNLFGGPDADELAGRELVARFEANFDSIDDMINQVADAVRAAGGTSEEAQALIKAMWDAEKQGAGATQAAIQKIIDLLHKIPTDVHVPVTVDYSFTGTPPPIPNDFPMPPDMPIEEMASGGSGLVTSPTMFYSAGNEEFAFSGEGKRFASGAREDGRMSQLLQAVAAELRALRQDQMQLLPLYLKAAVAQAH
jgi:hypothetical protein